MHSVTIGETTQSVLTERDLRLFWMGLKSLEEFGLPDKCVDISTEEEVEALLEAVTKACNQWRDKRGPLSQEEIENRIERQKHYANIRQLRAEREAREEAKRQAAAERVAKLNEIARKWRTYDYGSEWR